MSSFAPRKNALSRSERRLTRQVILARPRDRRSCTTSASGLVELSQLETDPTRGQPYRAAAANLLDSLASPTYLSSTSANAGLLLHGSRNYPGDNRTYMFGDYYFLEALLRYSRLPS